MARIPGAVLSEHFQQRMKQRRLLSAVFTTFRFEPGFFETEVLPVFLDVPLSHAERVKLVQLEDVLRSLPGHIAVYYDQHGLVAEGGSAKLDVRRIPIRHRTGIFHPKNVFALVESETPDENGVRARALLCACLSANLTRAGWWENVEVAHVEEITAGEHHNLREALLTFLDSLVKGAERGRLNNELRQEHEALSNIRSFLLGTSQRAQRSVDGRILPHFHDGASSVPDFLEAATRGALKGLQLEVISPYFDEAAKSEPLEALTSRFAPRELRVFLPKNDSGETLCADTLFDWVRNQKNTSWAALPAELLKLGKQEGARHRTVHAKVYRFFDPVRGGREFLFIGSVNLTQPGFGVAGRGGNVETGFLVEVTSTAKPDWWLTADNHRPASFSPRSEDEGAATSGGTQLVVRYHWDDHQALVLWGGKAPSPKLSVEHVGVCLFELDALPSCEWMPLDSAAAARLEKTLVSTSLLQVRGENPEPGLLLVQEEGMSHRPSLLLDLSPAEILRYWALLTIEQRAAFIEAHARLKGDDDPLVATVAPLPTEASLFDRFAGIFHAFSCLEERVRAALDAQKTKEADYRVFGKKYDSLGSLLGRVLSEVEAGRGDRVEQYVLGLCAKQLLHELGRDHPDYFATHRSDVKELMEQIAKLMRVRTSLEATSPEMPDFIRWFEKKFLKRAATLAEEDEA